MELQIYLRNINSYRLFNFRSLVKAATSPKLPGHQQQAFLSLFFLRTSLRFNFKNLLFYYISFPVA